MCVCVCYYRYYTSQEYTWLKWIWNEIFIYKIQTTIFPQSTILFYLFLSYKNIFTKNLCSEALIEIVCWNILSLEICCFDWTPRICGMFLSLYYLSMTLRIKLLEKITRKFKICLKFAHSGSWVDLFKVDTTGSCVMSFGVSLFLLPGLTRKATPQRPHRKEAQEDCAHGHVLYEKLKQGFSRNMSLEPPSFATSMFK